MSILAAALTLAIDSRLDLSALNRKATENAAHATCHIKTVGYRFVGTPGQQFRFDGDTYVVPQDGEVELIADFRSNSYSVEGRALPLDTWPLDQFGFRTVPMPSGHQAETDTAVSAAEGVAR